MLEFPDLWEDQDIQEFCDKAYSITGDPKTYPPCREEVSVFNIENLKKNIGNLLFNRGLSISIVFKNFNYRKALTQLVIDSHPVPDVCSRFSRVVQPATDHPASFTITNQYGQK